MVRATLLLMAVAALGYGAAAHAVGPTAAAPDAARAGAWFSVKAKVTRVVDGDTFVARVGRTNERVRLIGIDAPEVSDCYAKEAARAMRQLAGGKHVRLVGDRSQTRRDSYKRLLAYVTLDSGVDVGRELLRRGHAYLYETNPRFARYTSYANAAREAEASAAGLYAACGAIAEPVPPPAPTPPIAPPPPTVPTAPPPAPRCDPAYPTVCIPSPPPDLD